MPANPDEKFAHPRLAAVYDAFDSDRSDLDHYVAMVREFDARDVLDVGCGTGSLTVLLAGDPELAARGLQITAVDPAAASMAVSRTKPHADRVRWVHGTAPDVLPLHVDLALMTGNVAQVFLTEADWSETVAAVHEALRAGGRFVFETRVLERRVWQDWRRDWTRERVGVAHEGVVESWSKVTEVTGEVGDPEGVFVTFDSHTWFERDDTTLQSTSTLWFRSRAQIERSLVEAGFLVDEVREAPDRPGLEWVFIARRQPATGEARRPAV